MVKHTYQVLEFQKLLHILSSYASTPLGQSDCLSLKPATDLSTIDNEQRMVSEMKLLLGLRDFFAFENLSDIESILKSAQVKGSCLEPEALLSVFRMAGACKTSKKLIQAQKDLCPLLYQLVEKAPLLNELTEAILKAIDPNGTIKDSASHEIRRLRRQKRDLRRHLQIRLEKIQRSFNMGSERNDPLISFREGRYVIPLRTDRKNKVRGIVHDYSHTKETCFFEPIEVLEDNNRLAELSHHEKEEEFKILSELTEMVGALADDLLVVQMLLSKLDGLYARARFSLALKGISPLIDQGGVLDLRQAKNPILLSMASQEDCTVPVDILIDHDKNVLIISGPNRGGKTVTLKTIGLLSLMTQSGMHIPVAEGTHLPIFSNIFAEIGDDQDIQEGLSTFSAHVSHLKSILDRADQESLVIIDEPGMGTDPDEGAALAMAMLDDLSQRGALIAVSTHYNRLKTYGLLESRAKNASVEFDENSNQPTFKLRYGAPGTSYAFEMASEYGIQSDVIKRARGYLDEDGIRLNRLIDKLNQLKNEALEEKAKAEHAKSKYGSIREKLIKTRKQLELEKDAFIEKKRLESERMIHDARGELKQVVNSLKNRTGAQKDLTKQFEDVANHLTDHFQSDRPSFISSTAGKLKEGKWVRHKKFRHSGKLISLDLSNDKALIMSGNVKLTANLRDLEVLPDKEREEPGEVSLNMFHHISSPLAREINLVGYRVADALPIIDKVIDQTMIEGELALRIIHGHGTGQLKSAIRDHLKQFSCVKKVFSADPQSGGDAITIVELN